MRHVLPDALVKNGAKAQPQPVGVPIIHVNDHVFWRYLNVSTTQNFNKVLGQALVVFQERS